MKNKAHDLSSYSFEAEEQIMIDTNIWLYLFPAPGNPPQKFAKHYSSAFSKLIAAKALPVLDPIVLSEYLNRYCRIEWEGNKSKYPKFKNFRNSRDFRSVVASAHTLAKKIVSFCQIHSIAANELDLNKALSDFSNAQIDFNDAILIDICRKRNLKLMTNDGDFQEGGIDVLTTNRRLLSACERL